MGKIDHKFLKLTPIKDVDLITYEDAIDFVFENDDIKNVAISGPYGSGKSSVIESYKNHNKNYRYLHISLSRFDPTETIDECKIKDSTQNEEERTTENSNKTDEVILKRKILNQLIHQSDSKKIPQSNFKLKRNISNRQTLK